ncbi:MAG TPA: tRNA (adenosine(37)-N6)-threonylcarbamoyltransferase complex dimerization subunit type 1 TsaB [Candidatus Saccharimonadales bacterium]|nr:tRNA (adenosine(37)-N6)-threonylcarbamoyltransferase complex dimerization subunit type 1 TsaB [Candidatus Saccharimonadales bacterium]
MLILTLRTDKPEAEIGLFEDENQIGYTVWQAHRQLAETIQTEIEKLLQKQGGKLQEIQGIIAYQGPGSFTGLRIGLTVANALAYSLQVPIVATGSDNWISVGQKSLAAGNDDHLALPNYGADPHITTQKK